MTEPLPTLTARGLRYDSTALERAAMFAAIVPIWAVGNVVGWVMARVGVPKKVERV